MSITHLQKKSKISNLFGLWHISDNAISDDEQNEVLRTVSELPGDVGHVIDGGSEVGGAVQLDSVDAALVG